MVGVGNSRNRAEQRKKPRRHFNYGAVVIIDRKGTFVPCSLSDISENGARIAFESEVELPEHFILLLTPAGDARRRCRVVWQKGTTVGVSFRDPPP
jgi:hypothetical protein